MLIGAAAVSVPASAQSWGGDRGYGQSDRGYGYGYGQGRGYRSDDRIDHQLRQIEQRIHHARQQRMISRSEADRLLRHADQLDRLEDRYSRNGLTRWEVQDLRQRLQGLRQQLRFERQDGRWDNRGDRYDRYDRYDD
jgi:hypothetical protein